MDLSIGEAAMLAGLLKSPNNLSPWNSLTAGNEERHFVGRRMVENHKITKEQADQEGARPLEVWPKTNVVYESYVIDAIRQQVQSELDYESLASEGYKIYTTIDPVLQRAGEGARQQQLSQVERTDGYLHETYDQFSESLREWRADDKDGGGQPDPG